MNEVRGDTMYVVLIAIFLVVGSLRSMGSGSGAENPVRKTVTIENGAVVVFEQLQANTDKMKAVEVSGGVLNVLFFKNQKVWMKQNGFNPPQDANPAEVKSINTCIADAISQAGLRVSASDAPMLRVPSKGSLQD